MRVSGGLLSGTQDHPTQLFALERPRRPNPLSGFDPFSPGYTCFCCLRFCCAPRISTLHSEGPPDIWRLDYPFPLTHLQLRVHDFGYFTTLSCHLGMPLSSTFIAGFQASALASAGRTWLGTLQVSVMPPSLSTFDLGRCHLWDPHPGLPHSAFLCSQFYPVISLQFTDFFLSFGFSFTLL